MCDPVTVSVIAVGTTLASTAFSIVQSRQKAKSARATAEYNAGVSEYNARVSENEAQNVRNQATEAENAQRLKTARLLSKQKAQMGAANIDIGTGSALQLQEDTLSLGEADALRIRRSGDSQFAASMRQSELDRSKGDLARYGGEVAESQSKFEIAGSLLSGAAGIAGSGIADKWFTKNSVGNPFITKNNPLGLAPGQGL